MATQTEEQTVANYLEHAVEDLNQARQQAGEEIRTAIDSAHQPLARGPGGPEVRRRSSGR